VHRIRADFNRQVADTAKQLPSHSSSPAEPFRIFPSLSEFALSGQPQRDQDPVDRRTRPRADARERPAARTAEFTEQTVRGYRVISVPALVRLANGDPIGRVIIQYGRRVSDTEDTVRRWSCSCCSAC